MPVDALARGRHGKRVFHPYRDPERGGTRPLPRPPGIRGASPCPTNTIIAAGTGETLRESSLSLTSSFFPCRAASEPYNYNVVSCTLAHLPSSPTGRPIRGIPSPTPPRLADQKTRARTATADRTQGGHDHRGSRIIRVKVSLKKAKAGNHLRTRRTVAIRFVVAPREPAFGHLVLPGEFSATPLADVRTAGAGFRGVRGTPGQRHAPPSGERWSLASLRPPRHSGRGLASRRWGETRDTPGSPGLPLLTFIPPPRLELPWIYRA